VPPVPLINPKSDTSNIQIAPKPKMTNDEKFITKLIHTGGMKNINKTRKINTYSELSFLDKTIKKSQLKGGDESDEKKHEDKDKDEDEEEKKKKNLDSDLDSDSDSDSDMTTNINSDSENTDDKDKVEHKNVDAPLKDAVNSDDSLISEMAKRIRNQATEIHERVILKIMDVLGLDKSKPDHVTKAKLYKAGIYDMVKKNHPELNNFDRAVEMEKSINEKVLKSIDIDKLKKDIDSYKSSKPEPKEKAESKKAESKKPESKKPESKKPETVEKKTEPKEKKAPKAKKESKEKKPAKKASKAKEGKLREFSQGTLSISTESISSNNFSSEN
jgi:hypothetical protein